MTFKNARVLAMTVALAGASALPLAANAETQTAPIALPQVYLLNVVSYSEYAGGEYDGVMRLTVGADGILNGTYQAAYTGAPRIVAGAVRADGRVWLDIGREHLQGTFINGVLRTTASVPEPNTLHVDATPAARAR